MLVSQYFAYFNFYLIFFIILKQGPYESGFCQHFFAIFHHHFIKKISSIWKWNSLIFFIELIYNFRQLFSVGVRNSIRTFDGLLPHPNLHPLQSDRHHILGVVLAESRRNARPRRPWRHHCAHYDNPDGLDQRGFAKNFLCQVHWRLPRRMFLYGVRFTFRLVYWVDRHVLNSWFQLFVYIYKIWNFSIIISK